MIPSSFEYVAPTSVEGALAALDEAGEDAKVLGGGQSLLPVLRMRLNTPSMVVDLGRVSELRGIQDGGDHLQIGAMTTYQEVLDSDLVGEHALLLQKAVATVGDPQIRHRGTVGGSAVHADPAGDLGAPLLALRARMVVRNRGGEREIPAEEFFKDLFQTAVVDGELLTAIRIPKHAGWGAHYEKFVRVAQQWAIVAVAATVRLEGGVIAQAGVGLTNMGATPLRANGVEQALVGCAATESAVRAACAAAAEGTNPPTDLNGDAAYRRHLAPILARRAVLAAAGG